MSRRPSSAGSAAAVDRNLQEQVLQVLQQSAATQPDGIGLPELIERTGMTSEDTMGQLNHLMASKRVTLANDAAGNLHVRLAAGSEVKLKGLSAEEMLVYQVIKQAGNSGVWTKDMKIKTNLAQPQITKIIKTLESRALIKSVKSVANPSRKLYMLSDLDPSREITGGAWYSNQEFDSAFIDALQRACFKYIEDHGRSTLEEVTAFIAQTGMAKVALGAEDIECIIRTLIYECRVEEAEGEDGEALYQLAVAPLPATTPWTALPCGSCPAFGDCKPGGAISPETCVYYKAWLDF